MTRREWLAAGGVRAELKACIRRPVLSQELFGLAFEMRTPDMRRLLFKFAREAKERGD